MLKNNKNELFQKAKEAIDHIDAGLAEQVLKEIKKHQTENSNTVLADDLEKLKLHMQIVTFLSLTENETANIISKHILDFFKINIPLRERIQARYNYLGYGPNENSRKSIKEAILKNTETLGNITLGNWIKNFNETKIVEKPNKTTSFILQDSNVQKLSPLEKALLKETLYTYETLIHSEIKDALGRKVPKLKDYIEKDSSSKTIVSLSLKEAFQKYPKLKEQMLTSQKIAIKNIPTLVRPTINNWLSDYVFNFGYGKHDAIQRSRYIFQGKNSHNLSESDRQKLSFILKSFDENSIVEIDENSSEIIFPEAESPDLSKVNLVNKNFSLKKKEGKIKKLIPGSFKKTPLMLPQPKKVAIPPEENIQKTEFDFHQKMPFENQQKQAEIAEKKLSPYRIIPLSKKEESASDEETFHIERKAPSSNQKNSKNIVNLREL